MTTQTLGDLIACATAEQIMAGLRRLDPARFDDTRARVGQLAAVEYTGRAEDPDDLDPAGRAAMLPRATDPEVIRYAEVVLAAIQRDMAAPRQASSRFPATSAPSPSCTSTATPAST